MKSGVHKRLPAELLSRMSELVSPEDRDEMAIPSYLHPNPLMRWIAWRRVDEVASLYKRYFAQPDSAKDLLQVMDFGCGSGVLFEELSRQADRVVGVDNVLEPARLLIAESHLPNVSLMTPEMAEAELTQHSLDAIVAAEVLEHIEPLRPTLDFFNDRLKPTGKLLVSVPTENRLYRLGRRLAGFANHYHESHAAAIHSAILESGFRAIRLSKIPGPGPLAVYWIAAYEPVSQGG